MSFGLFTISPKIISPIDKFGENKLGASRPLQILSLSS